MMPTVRQTIEDNVFHNLRGKVRVLASILDEENRTLLGASALAWEVKEYSLFK
jgi:glucokinase